MTVIGPTAGPVIVTMSTFHEIVGPIVRLHCVTLVQRSSELNMFNFDNRGPTVGPEVKSLCTHCDSWTNGWSNYHSVYTPFNITQGQ